MRPEVLACVLAIASCSASGAQRRGIVTDSHTPAPRVSQEISSYSQPTTLMDCRLRAIRIDTKHVEIDLLLSPQNNRHVYFAVPRGDDTSNFGDTYGVTVRRYARHDALHVAFGAFLDPDAVRERHRFQPTMPMCSTRSSVVQTFTIPLPLREGMSFEDHRRQDDARKLQFSRRGLLLVLAIGHFAAGLDTPAPSSETRSARDPLLSCHSILPRFVFAQQQWCETWAELPESVADMLANAVGPHHEVQGTGGD